MFHPRLTSGRGKDHKGSISLAIPYIVAQINIPTQNMVGSRHLKRQAHMQDHTGNVDVHRHGKHTAHSRKEINLQAPFRQYIQDRR